MAVAAWVAWVSGSAALAGTVQIRRIDLRDYPIVRVLVVGPTVGGRPPTLTDDGVAADGMSVQNLGGEESVVLMIDRSQSMHGRTLADAVAAASAFVADKPSTDQISVMVVGSQAISLSSFSADSIDADAALRAVSIDPRYGTVLWDGVVLAAHTLAAHGLPGRAIILLTDGQNTTSRASLREAIDAARAAGAAVFTIGIPDLTYTPQPLAQLSAATGGRFYPAGSPADLGRIYRAVGAVLRRSWQLEYPTADRPGDTLRVLVRFGAQSASATTTIPTALAVIPAAHGSHLPVLLLVVIIGGSLAIGGIALWRRLPRHRMR